MSSKVASFFGESLSEVVFARKPKVNKFEELAETILNSCKFIAKEERKNIIAQLVINKFDVDQVNFTRFRNRLKDSLWVLWRKGWLYGEEEVRTVYFSDNDDNYVAEFNDVLDGLQNIITGLKSQITTNKQEITVLERNIVENSKSLTSAKKQLEVLLQKTGNVEKINIIDDIIQNLEENIKTFKEQIKEKNAENTRLKEQVKLFTEQFKEQKTEIENVAKTTKIQELQAQLKKLQEKQQTSNRLDLNVTKQIKEKTEELNKLQREKSTTKRAVKISEETGDRESGVLKTLSDKQLQNRINQKIKKRQELSLKKVEKLQGEVLETPVDLRQKRLDIVSAKIVETEKQVEQLRKTGGEKATNAGGKSLYEYKELKEKVKNKIPLTIQEQTFYDVEKEFRLNLTKYNSSQTDDGKITKIATAFEKYEELKKKNPQSLTDAEQWLIDGVEEYRVGLETITGKNTTNLDVAKKRLDHLKRKKSLLENESLPDKFYKETVKTRLEQTAQTSKNVEVGINYYIDQSDFGRIYLEKRLEFLAKSYEEQEKKHILKRMSQVFQLATDEDEIIIGEDGKVKNKSLQTKIQEYFEKNRLTYFPRTGEMKGSGGDYNVLGAEGLVAGKRQVFDPSGNLSDKRAIPADNKFRLGVGNYYKDLGTIGQKQQNFISREARLIDYYRGLIYGDAPKTAENILKRLRIAKDSDVISLTPEEQKALGFVGKDSVTVKTLRKYAGERKTLREYVDKNGNKKTYNVIDDVDIKKDVLNVLLKKYNITDKNKKITISSDEARSLGVTNRNLSYNALKRHVDGLQMDYFSSKAARIVRTELAAANHLGRLNYIVENDDIGLVRWVVDKEHIFRRAVCERINKKDIIFKNSTITHGMGCVGRSLGQSIGVGKTLSGIYRTVDVLTQPTLMVPLHPYCMCEVRPLKKNELDNVLLGVTGEPTTKQLTDIGAGTVTAGKIASREVVAEEENKYNPLGTFLAVGTGVIVTTIAAISAYKLAFSNKQIAQKIIREVDDNLPRKSTDIISPKLPTATRRDLQKGVKESLVIDEMLKDTQLPEKTPLKIPLKLTAENKELVESQLSIFRNVRENAESLLYGLEHFDEFSDEGKRALLNIDLPENLEIPSIIKPYVEKDVSFLEQVLQEGKVAKRKLENDINRQVILLPPKNDAEIRLFEKRIKRFVDKKGRGYDYYDEWLAKINDEYRTLYADLPTRSGMLDYNLTKHHELTKRLKNIEKQHREFDESFFKKLGIKNYEHLNLTAYLETLEADGVNVSDNMREFIESRGFLENGNIAADLLQLSEIAQYKNKITKTGYKSLFKPDGKRKIGNLTLEGLVNKDAVLREIQTLLDNENKTLNKKQIKYLVEKYNASTLEDFVQSSRIKPNKEELEKINNLLQEEIRQIQTTEFNRFQKKWATFGSPQFTRF